MRGLRYESNINDRFPTYWNLSRIGDGGGGVVFKVRDQLWVRILARFPLIQGPAG